MYIFFECQLCRGSPAPSNQTGNVGQSRAPVESKVESAASTTPSAISIKVAITHYVVLIIIIIIIIIIDFECEAGTTKGVPSNEEKEGRRWISGAKKTEKW